jgi:hypothetical protein
MSSRSTTCLASDRARLPALARRVRSRPPHQTNTLLHDSPYESGAGQTLWIQRPGRSQTKARSMYSRVVGLFPGHRAPHFLEQVVYRLSHRVRHSTALPKKHQIVVASRRRLSLG